jgi:hypothetical protein
VTLGLFHNTDRVLKNPRWRQNFTVYKRARIPDEHGRALPVGTTAVEAAGIIHPTSGKDLDRLMEGDRASESITVFSDTPLSTGTDDRIPDEVEWRGTRYMVSHVQDWGDYGAGWCKAICTARGMRREDD